MVIDLPKSGYAVTFKDFMPQRAFEAYLRELSAGLNPREVVSGKDDKGVPTTQILNDKIDYATVDAAVRAALPYLVESISKDGRTAKFSSNWALDISKSDFSLLATEVTRLKEEEERAQAEGKKNSGNAGAGAVDGGSESAS